MGPPPRRAAVWLGAALFAGGTLSAMGATVLWVRDAVNNAYFLRSTGPIQNARAGLQENVDRQVRDLNAVADGVSTDGEFGPEAFQHRAARALGDSAPMRALDFVDRSGRVLWTFPFSPERRERGLTGARSAAADRAGREQRTTASGLIDLWDGRVGVALYAPVFRGSLWTGLVEGTLEVWRVALAGAPGLGERFDVTFVDETQGREYRPVESPGRASPAYDHYFPLNLADRTWWVILHPLRPPPALAIVVGALLLEALLGGVVVYLWLRRHTA